MIGRTNCTQKSGSPSEFVNIQMLTNQAEHSNLNGVVLTMSYETYSKQYTWDGSEITFSVPAHVSCTIEFPEVEGYKKPDNITFVAVEGNSRTIEAEYKAELVKVNVTSSNGSAVSGATLTINGKQQTWNGTEIRQLVPFGTQYSVVAGAVSGFGTPSTQTFTAQNPEREVSVVYIASSLKVNILSNQGTDAAIANVKATVKYGSTSVQVANGSTVNIPSGTSGTITFPDVEGYKKPSDISFTHNGGVTEKTGTYQCELLTVNVSADSGSVSGFEVTISKQEIVGVATKYTRLDYIESNGSQYIDTGITPSDDLEVEISFKPTSSVAEGAIFGSDWSTTGYFLMYYNSKWRFHTRGYVFDSSSSINSSKFTTLKTSSSSIIIDETKSTWTKGSSTDASANILLFYTNGSYTGRKYGLGQVAYMKMWKSGSLVRDFVPALRSDGIAGLYDAVNDKFYASNGSSNFIAGNKDKELIATQTSVTGSYKIPFDASYVIEASKVSGYNKPNPITRIASQKSYTANMQYTVITEVDLSLQDIYGNPINRSTANCYVVREAGTYKFPLVYGNAIKDGKVNTAAFTNNGGANSHDFVESHKSSAITSPYIETYLGSKITSANVINTDHDGCITNISVIDGEECSYVQFTVSEVPFQGANSVISVSKMYVAWSWHIWLWPHDLSPVEITNSTGVKYKIMPVNLASKYDSDGVHIKNWFYQWGRKDPILLPSVWNSTTNHTLGSVTISSKADNLRFGIMEPTTFFINSSDVYNWFGDKGYYNLWDAACTNVGSSDNDTVKTVYDPCPVGWKVPNGNTFTGLSIISNANGIVKMARYSGDTVGVDFPLSGYRINTSGDIVDVAYRTHVWTASSYSQERAYELESSSGTVSSGSAFRARGYSIRPVQDDLTKIDKI